jgi:hypothetical protein
MLALGGPGAAYAGTGGAATETEISAEEGVEITIRAEPAGGASFKGWEAAYGGAKVSGAGDNPATFSMPASDVTIIAIFEYLSASAPLSLGDLAFDPVEYGYPQPAARTVKISNPGTAEAAVSVVELSERGKDTFDLGGALTGFSVPAGGEAGFTVQPKAGLDAGEYTGFIIVNYGEGFAAVGVVTMAVGKAPGAEAPKPEAAANGVTPTSITVKPASALSTGQNVERAISESADGAGLSQWQTGTGFTGLDYGKTYYVYARSMESANYRAGAARPSDPIPTIELSRDFMPVKIDVTYGYGPGEGEKAVTISNTGEVAATVKSITLTDITPGAVSPLFEL